MKRQKIFRSLISFVLVGVLLCTPFNYVQASTSNSNNVNTGNSSVTSDGNSSNNTGWTYLNDDGYKMTTYILATTDLDYMNSLPSKLKTYLVNSREGLKSVRSSMGTNSNKLLKKYTNKVSYYGKGSQTYIADYYQQLGNPMSIQVVNSTGRSPGYVAMTTSPHSHLSRFEDDSYTSSSSVNEDMISKYRSEIKLSPTVEGKVSKSGTKGVLNLGNFVDSSDTNWLSVDGFSKPGSISDIQGKAGTRGFLSYAIANSMASGLYYTGVSCSNLSKFGVSVKRVSNGNKVSGKKIKLTKITATDSDYFFSMNSDEYPKDITCYGYYTENSTNVNVKFTCRQVDLLDAFLYKYQVDGEHYTWKDLCLDKNSNSDKNYGLNISVVVIIEPIKMTYYKGSMSTSKKKKYYGQYFSYARNNSSSTNGLFLSIRDRAYWLGGKRATGLAGMKKQKAWNSGSASETTVDEKYSAGLCLNYVTGNGIDEQTKLITRMNAMMYSGSTYAEFPKVKAGSGSRCGNGKSFKYNGKFDTINKSKSATGSGNKNLTGGIACIGYYHEMDLDSTSSVNPFPSLTVRHIDSTALNESDSNENVLMRDSVTWTVPASIGLAVENDVARATFLAENKGLYYAYGGDDDSVSYEDLDYYLKKVWSNNSNVKARFGNNKSNGDSFNGNISTSSDNKSKRLAVMKKAMEGRTYQYNGIKVKPMSYTGLLKGAYKKSGKSQKEFMTIVKSAHKGDTNARSDYYSWCMEAIVDYYSDYKVRIPLLRSDEANSSTKISSGSTYWAMSAKPLTSCSGNYEYYDGAIESGSQTTQRKALAKSIEKLNTYKVSSWDTAESRDNEFGTTNKNTFGETTVFKTGKTYYPGIRAMSVLDYYVEGGSVHSNTTNNSVKSKLNFLYGKSFRTDRAFGSTTKYSWTSLATSKFRSGTLEVDGSDKKAYYPSGKIIKSYADVMYDVSIFNNSVGFMEKANGQTVNCLVDNADQLRASNSGGKQSWSYLMFPEYSLGSRMLMGNDCTNKLVDVNAYSKLGSSGNSDFGIKAERKTKEPLMSYWNNTKYKIYGDSSVNIRENMFFDEGTSKRAYNNVWVPDLGNNSVNLNKAEIKASSNGINGGQTATGKMFEVTEKIYGITLAYNPEMSSADSWTYRIGSGYENEAKDINTTGKNNVPSECSVNLVTDSAVKVDTFGDRCSSLGVAETLYSMPDSIAKLSQLNKGDENRNFIKYSSSDGWKFLNSKFDNSGTKKYSTLLAGNSTYTLNLSEGTKPNAYYININVGDWIQYGDLGTLDAYYDTVPSSKIYDLSLDLDTDSEGMSEFDMNSLLLTTDYSIKSSKISSGYTIEKKETSYNMETKASERGYDKKDREYIGTVSIKGDDIKLLSKTVSSGNKCISMLRSGTVLYQLEEQIVDLKAGLLALNSDEVIYYINVWADGDEDEVDLVGDTYIRSDELVSAAKISVPNDSLKLKAVADPPACVDSGHSVSEVESVNWKNFSATVRNTEPWRVLGGTLVYKNPFTVLGKTDNEDKLFGMEWLGNSESKWKNGGTTLGNEIVLPNDLSVGVLLHRSTVDTETKEYSLTPPLAEYMCGTEANKKYVNFCKDYDVPVDVDSGKGNLNLSNQYGWYSKGKVRMLAFDLFDGLNIGKNGDLDYYTSYSAKYSCAVGDYIIDHEKDINNKDYKIKGSYTDDDKKKVKVAVEGTYVANSSDNEVLKPEVYTEKNIGGTDTEILYKVPTRVSFTPTYLMRSDYNVENYEVDNKEGTANEEKGNREKVWVLGSKERTMNVYNLHSLKITGAQETKVQAPWSTDSRDKQNYNETGKPTVKAGSAYKMSKTDINLQVQSVVYLLDESFYSGSGLTEVRAFNKEALKSHQDLLNKVKNCVDDEDGDGSYSFVYTSLPGGYDEKLSSKYRMFKNKFTNVIQGLRHEYNDSEFSKVFNKTKVKSKINYCNFSTSVSSNYLNKDYNDSDYSTSDFTGSRGMNIEVDGNTFNLSPKLLNVTSDILLDDSVEEVSKCKKDALKEYYSQLQRATKAGKTWYKEDFEGVLQVTITSNISVQLDSDYSIIWDNLSDWQDKEGVKPYTEAKPSAESFDGDSSVNVISSNPNATNKIPAGEIGAGYGFLMEDIELDGANYGTACMMLKPYLFEVRGNVYDDVSK